MKRIVRILAMTACITGCGVGVDDPEGMAATMGSTFALEANTVVPVGSPSAVNVYGAPTTEFGGGTVSAPQDPIPFFDPRLNQPVGAPPPGHPLPR
ncbi:MAG: hypothetical protein WBV82_26120 [Myxococcaceae bacterium]